MIGLRPCNDMVDHVQRLVADHFPHSREELVLGDRPLSRLCELHGTPLFLYCGEIASAHLARLRSALESFDVFYSVKANPNSAWLRYFVKNGCGLSVATEGELNLALGAGCPPERIILAGAGKTESELWSGVKAKVAEIHVESLEEIASLERIAGLENQSVKVVLRLNPGEISKARDGQFTIEKRPAAYGFDEEDVQGALKQLAHCKHLVFWGIHTYFGTQHLDSKAFLSAYRCTFALACRVSQWAGAPLQTLDLGGGFGVPYYPEDQPFDIEGFGSQLGPYLAELRDQSNFKSVRLCVEPGRYLVAEAGIYVTKVIGIKTSYGKKFVIVDGGVHHHLAAAGRLGGIVRNNFPIAVGNRMTEANQEVVSVTGRQCSAFDTLARNVALPQVSVGDPLVFFQSGAYTLTVSPQSFRSHPKAAEILLE